MFVCGERVVVWIVTTRASIHINVYKKVDLLELRNNIYALRYSGIVDNKENKF